MDLNLILPYLMISLTLVLLIASFFGAILPIIPGLPVAAAGILLYKLVGTNPQITWYLVLVSIALAAISQVLDIILGIWGTKKFGGTNKGAWGAILGSIVGIFLPLPPFVNIFVGAMLGAFIFEFLWAKQNVKSSTKSSIGTMIGLIASTAMKVSFSFIILVWFSLEVFF